MPTASLTEEDVLAVLRSFFLQCVPAGVEVLVTQQNRVPQPIGPNFVMMTPSARTFLSSSYHEYLPDEARALIGRSTSATFQIDVYGPDSTDITQVIATLFRDDFACQAMAGTGVQPLYCNDGSQMPLDNAEKQYEARWMLTVVVQIDPSVSTPAQFADSVVVTIVEAD